MAASEHPPFDAVIPFHSKDSDIIPYCVFGLRKNMKGLRNIYIVSAEEPEDLDDVVWVPESRFPFTKADVAAIIKSTNRREGWYLQQLLKLYVFRVIEGIHDHVLIFDADCVPCRPIEFFKAGKILLDWTTEIIYEPYFAHATRVLRGFHRVNPTISGIRDHMLFRRDILEGMLHKIEIYNDCKEAWKVLLEAVEPGEYDKSGMSEYEMYYNYALTWWAEDHERRQLKRGCGSSIRALTEGSDSADFIVFHTWIMDEHKNDIESSKRI
jgi:hypothetical protein